MAETTGYIDFHYKGESFKTWYNLVGEITQDGPTPIVILHGGPGIPNAYLDVHKDLYPSLTAPIIFYDQIGCGRSTHLKDKPPTFWTVDLFKDELSNVLNHFGISSNFDLLGHSWGGMLASDYVISRQPKGLRRLVLASAISSVPIWNQALQKLIQRMPSEASEAIQKHEKEGTMDDPEYKKWSMVFLKKHVCTLDPPPEDFLKSFNASREDRTANHAMFGVLGFAVDGSLASWSVVGELNAVKVPTLIMNGVEDEVPDEVIKPFVDEIPNIKWVKFQKSSHMPFFEERETYMKVVSDFLA